MADDAPTIGPDTGGFPVPDKDDLYAPRQAFPDSGAAWDKDIYVPRLRWNQRLDKNKPADPRADPNMSTRAPDVGSAPAEWNYQPSQRRTMGDT